MPGPAGGETNRIIVIADALGGPRAQHGAAVDAVRLGDQGVDHGRGPGPGAPRSIY